MMSENINQLREQFRKRRYERYPLENAVIRDETDFIKNYYLTLLAAVLVTGRDMEEAQRLLFSRIVKGITADGTVEDYIRKALALDVKECGEFIDMFKEMEAVYRWLADGMLLIHIVEKDVEKMEFLCELAEVFEISLAEIEEVSRMVKYLLEGNGLQLRTMLKSKEGLYEDYYAAFIEDVIEESEESLKLIFMKKTNIFEELQWKGGEFIWENKQEVHLCNVIFDLKDTRLEVKNVGSVVFENCEFIGGKYYIFLKACGPVRFVNCYFHGFEKGVIVGNMRKCPVLEVENCQFMDCFNRTSGQKTRSIIETRGDTERTFSVLMINSEFTNVSNITCCTICAIGCKFDCGIKNFEELMGYRPRPSSGMYFGGYLSEDINFGNYGCNNTFIKSNK